MSTQVAVETPQKALPDTSLTSDAAERTSIFLDFDTVLLATHPGRYGPELGLQADLPEAIERMSEVADSIVVVVDPTPVEHNHALDTANRMEVLNRGLGGQLNRLVIVSCQHGEAGDCDCAKPQFGLISQVLREQSLASHLGWYVAGDQEGVVAGRGAGLKTIRIGPAGEDHLSAVHRADFEARDLMDAANRIMLEALTGD